MRAIFIRHGQSSGNAGVPCHDLGAIELAELGQEQAREVAASWIEAPRAHRHVALYSQPADRRADDRALSRRAGGSVADRRVHLSATGALERHAQRQTDAAPRTLLDRGRSGLLRRGGAESFSTMLRRCEAALAQLAAMAAASLVYVFGHGQFLQAARAIVADAHLDEVAKMRAFWRKGEPPAISDAQRVGFHWQGGRWACAPATDLPGCWSDEAPLA